MEIIGSRRWRRTKHVEGLRGRGLWVGDAVVNHDSITRKLLVGLREIIPPIRIMCIYYIQLGL